jgi:hypothetical protein
MDTSRRIARLELQVRLLLCLVFASVVFGCFMAAKDADNRPQRIDWIVTRGITVVDPSNRPRIEIQVPENDEHAAFIRMNSPTTDSCVQLTQYATNSGRLSIKSTTDWRGNVIIDPSVMARDVKNGQQPNFFAH